MAKYLDFPGLETLWARIKAKITAAIQALDVSSVGGDGKYISAISETDGKISATATTMDTTPTANSKKAVTSGGIANALAGKSSTSHSHDDRYIRAGSGNKTLSFGGTTTLGTVQGSNVNLVMPEANADTYLVSANSTSFSDVLAAYNAHKKLILQIGFPLPGSLDATYNIPLDRIVYSDGTPVIFVWVYTQDSLTGDTNRGVITTWSLGSSGWASETKYTYFADTAGLSNKASALMDFGDKDQKKVTRVGWAGSSIGKVIASGSAKSLSESSYLAAYYVADGTGHVKDVKAANVTVGNATKAAAAGDSEKWGGWKIVVGSTGTDANTLYFV